MFRIISIEGNIGSGKSTFLEKLREKYASVDGFIFSTEPVHLWEKIKDESGKTMLQKFYENQEKYSFSFQMMAYISRLSILRGIVKNISNISGIALSERSENARFIIITERSLFTDKHVFAKMLHDDGLIEDVNYQIYEQWFDEFSKDLPVDQHIYLKASPKMCYNRIHYRSRAGEEKIPLVYLENCDQYHDEFLEKYPHIVLDANQNVFDEKVLEDWIMQFQSIVDNIVWE